MQYAKTKTSVIPAWKDVLKRPVFSLPLTLEDGLRTRVYVVRQKRQDVRPRVAVFSEPATLLDWCLKNKVETAIVGGFDLHHTPVMLGEYWVNGQKLVSEPVAGGWHQQRGAVEVKCDGDIAIAPRGKLSKQPSDDLMQAGPVLVFEGENIITPDVSPEGFSETAHQFTPDPSVGRHPRSAIGYNDDYIWTVVCDGRTEENAGLHLHELAEFMKMLGAEFALNLDGGSSAQLVRRGKLLNDPWGQHGDHYPEGLPVRSAIFFENI